MSISMFITFRGEEEIEIEYDDKGYESDTNVHEIDWRFVDEEYQDLDLTSEEEFEIANLIGAHAIDHNQEFNQ